MNALTDPVLISAMYEASNKGVKIDLIIRGICCLVPQQPGLSENIRVLSIVGRFLEHSRIYYFYNAGKEEIYCSSADFMQRNLDRRVEVAFPIKDDELKEFLKNTILQTCLEDNVQGRILLPDGIYRLNRPVYTEEVLSHQEYLMSEVIKNPESTLREKMLI